MLCQRRASFMMIHTIHPFFSSGLIIPLSLLYGKKVRVWDDSDQQPMNSSLHSQQLYKSSQHFPFWIMLSDTPFSDDIGERSLRAACENSTTRKRIAERRHCSKWICPKFTQGRYVRIQMEGFGCLSLSQAR